VERYVRWSSDAIYEAQGKGTGYRFRRLSNHNFACEWSSSQSRASVASGNKLVCFDLPWSSSGTRLQGTTQYG